MLPVSLDCPFLIAIRYSQTFICYAKKIIQNGSIKFMYFVVDFLSLSISIGRSRYEEDIFTSVVSFISKSMGCVRSTVTNF